MEKRECREREATTFSQPPFRFLADPRRRRRGRVTSLSKNGRCLSRSLSFSFATPNSFFFILFYISSFSLHTHTHTVALLLRAASPARALSLEKAFSYIAPPFARLPHPHPPTPPALWPAHLPGTLTLSARQGQGGRASFGARGGLRASRIESE